MRYILSPMNTKNIVIGIVVLLIIVFGAYAIMGRPAAPAPVAGNTPGTTNSTAGAATTSPQVQAQEVTAGTGAVAAPGMQASVLYVGKLTDGTVFDSSALHNNEPLVFVLGQPGLIPGFQIGVNGMKEGGERLIAIPASLGYGDKDVKDASGKVIIPANSTLVFDVKLVKVGPAPAAPAKTGATPVKK